MTVLFRSIVVWLVMLALPYQGYAAARMMLCAAPAPAQASHAAMVMPVGPHDHAAMMAAMDNSSSARASSDNGASSSHTSMKCGGSACCVAVAPVLAVQVAPPGLPIASRPIPFYSGFLPAVYLANPERPPQGSFA